MFYSTNNTPPHLSPVNLPIQILVYQATQYDVLSPDDVEAMTYFRTPFFIVWGANYAFDCFSQYQVGDLINGQKRASQGSTVSRNDENLF